MSNFQRAGDWEQLLRDKIKAILDPLIRANYKDRFNTAFGCLSADPENIRLQGQGVTKYLKFLLWMPKYDLHTTPR